MKVCRGRREAMMRGAAAAMMRGAAAVVMRGAAAALLVLVCAGPGSAQSVPRVVAGWGVDTAQAAWTEHAWHASVPEIFRLWASYLRGSPERQEPTALWSAAEQHRGVYDLTAGTAYKGFPATVLDIRPALDGDSVFVIHTLFAAAAGEARDVRPVALTRVYAVRENGRWVLSGALPRAVQRWHATSLGAFRFLSPPTRPLDRARAERAVAFADSLADALGVPRLRDVTYIAAADPAELHRLMGIDWTFGGLGHGYALPGLVLSGDAAFGEENRHEIVHLVLQPIAERGRTSGFVNEGVATRFGGSAGRAFGDMVRDYAAFMRTHPDLTLDAVLEGEGADRGWRPAGAVLVDMVLERRGTAGLLTLLEAGRGVADVRAAAADLLGLSWPEVAAAWRRRIEAATR